MEERSPKNAVLQTVKTVLIVLAVFAASILYIFVSSAVQGRNYKGKTSDMYGTDSLEYVGEPVMKISVWQRNIFNKEDYPDTSPQSSFFYNLVPLVLIEGTTVCNVVETTGPLAKTHFNSIFNIEYEGILKGEYDIKWEGALIYCEMSDIYPNNWFSNGFAHEDASFEIKGNMTMNVISEADNLYNLRVVSNKEFLSYEKKHVEDYNIWDYASEQSIHEVYPDAPDSLSQVYRLVITGDLTINAMHERKEDVPIATAVLEIKQYSKWIAPDVETSRELEKFCDSISYADVTVKSYTQTVQWE